MKRLVFLVLILAVLLSTVRTSHAAVTGVGPNINVAGESPPDRQAVEPTVAIDPRNPSILVAGAQDLRLVSSGEHRWHGYYRSTDGGQTWSSILLPGFPGDNSPQGLSSPLAKWNATSDPVMAFDRNGNLYYAGLTLNITSNGFIPNTGLFVAKFTNDGSTYSATTLISAGMFPDKPWIAVDTTGGVNDGNVYVVYDANLTATQDFGTLFIRSVDGGITWSAPFYVPADMSGELPGVTVDPSGNVYVSTDAFDPVSGNARGFIQVSKLINGGSTLVGTVVAQFVALIPSPLPGGSFRAFTIPQIAADGKSVYLVWDDFRTGNANVLLTRSTDGGITWSIPLRVNDATAGQHFFPTITSSGSIISVAWYDSRLNTGSSMTSLDVFYAQSTDGGNSFSSSIRVTGTSFNPNTVLRSDPPCTFCAFLGDYISIAASPSMVYPVWTDNINACDTVVAVFGCVDQDVFTAAISVTLSPPDFAITASPSSLTVPLESTRQSTITLTSLNGFTGTVTLSSSISPVVNMGPTITLSSTLATVSPGGSVSVVLTVTAKGSTPLGSYTVTITASSGALVHSIPVPVTIVKEHAGK